MNTTETPDVDLKLTDSAVEQVKKLLARDQREGYGLRAAVADGGCSGYSYKLDFDKDQKAEDLVLGRNGVRVYIHRTSPPYLAGRAIDLGTALYAGRFQLRNAKAP